MQRLTRKLALIVTLALLASLILALTVGRPQAALEPEHVLYGRVVVVPAVGSA